MTPAQQRLIDQIMEKAPDGAPSRPPADTRLAIDSVMPVPAATSRIPRRAHARVGPYRVRRCRGAVTMAGPYSKSRATIPRPDAARFIQRCYRSRPQWTVTVTHREEHDRQALVRPASGGNH